VLSNLEEGYVLLRSSDQESSNRNEFRPNSYFYYLTGCEVPNTYALLSNRAASNFILSLPPHRMRSLIYQGENLPEEKVNELFQPDRLVSYSEFRILLDSIIHGGAPIYLDRNDRAFLCDLKRRSGEDGTAEFRSVAMLVDELRVLKDPFEIERLQKACNITSRALINVMKECSEGKYEFEMESIIEGTFLQFGASMPGFPSIVGSGPNSTILHYESNTRFMKNGEILVMDIGAEYGHYTADITRTIPVNGRFREEQRIIYQLVLDAQKAAINSLKPGSRIGDGHQVARDMIIRGLADLGLITDTTSSWQSKFYIVYPISHYLGLDVHDVGDYGGFFANFRQDTLGANQESRLLEPGMVLTIEPGLYFREKGLQQLYELFNHEADSTEITTFINQVAPVYEKYINLGVRIEDDILITKDGNINLSRYAPKEIEDIEQLMR